MFEYLVSSRFNSFNGIILNNNDLANEVTDTYVDIVSQELRTNFDQKLKLDIKNHVLSMIRRLKMNISLPNALLNDIKLEYPDIFSATKNASVKISKQFKLPEISDDEIGYLCLYFAKSYEENISTTKRVRTYVICTTGIGTSQIISTKIRKKIPEIDIVGMASNINIEEILRNEKNIDFLISTIPIKAELKIPVEIVSAFFTKQDEDKIRTLVKELINNRLKS